MQETSQVQIEQWLDDGLGQKYVPSNVEKKKAIVMYVLFGIMMIMSKPQMNIFEYFHLKQSVGWWVSFVLFFVVFAVLLFLPVIKYLWLIPLVALIVMWAIFVKQAWDGVYYSEKEKSPLLVFSSMGAWLLWLFEISPEIGFGGMSSDVSSVDVQPQQVITPNQQVPQVSQPPVSESDMQGK